MEENDERYLDHFDRFCTYICRHTHVHLHTDMYIHSHKNIACIVNFLLFSQKLPPLCCISPCVSSLSIVLLLSLIRVFFIYLIEPFAYLITSHNLLLLWYELPSALMIFQLYKSQLPLKGIKKRKNDSFNIYPSVIRCLLFHSYLLTGGWGYA